MFGNEPISSTPLSSLLQRVQTYFKALSYVTTVASNISNRAINKILAITTAITLAIVKFISVTKSVNTTVTSTLNKVTTYLKTLTVTVLNTISLLTQRIVHQTLSVVVSNVISVTKAIAKIFSTIHDTMIIVLTSLAFHLVGMSIAVSNTISIKRGISKTISIVTNITALLFLTFFKTFNTVVGNTIKVRNTFFKTLLAIVSMTKNGCLAGIAVAGIAIAGSPNNVTLAAKSIAGRILTVTVTTTASFKRFYPKLFSVASTVTPSIRKLLTLFRTMIAAPVYMFVTLMVGVIPIFGAVASKTYYAYERMRTMVLVKVRTIFANKGDNNG